MLAIDVEFCGWLIAASPRFILGGMLTRPTLLVLSLIIVPAAVSAQDAETKISDAQRRDDGILSHRVESGLQRAATEIRVLAPERIDRSRAYPVVYVLPVEAGNRDRYGGGLREIRKLDLHNRRDVIFVAPTFADLPWYADHPTDERLRQETYLLREVIPYIERTYPVQATTDGRLLLGFSKSGWGAWSLLLRHPDFFDRAVAWDAPLMMTAPGRYGSGPIFGTQENFEKYQISRLLQQRTELLRTRERLILLGYGGFRAEHQAAHTLLTRLEIPHAYRDGPQRKHDWHSGWVAEAVDLLLDGKADPQSTPPEN